MLTPVLQQEKKVVFGCYSVFFSAAMTYSDQKPLGEERVGLAYTSGSQSSLREVSWNLK